MYKHYSLLALLCLFALRALGQQPAAFSKELFLYQGDTLPYQVLYPQGYDPAKSYPMVLFLHGAGERGRDNERQMALGTHIFLQPELQAGYPAIVLVPQCSADYMWTHRQKQAGDPLPSMTFPLDQAAPKPTQLVDALVDSLLASGKVDAKRVYLMGISMGGIGSLDLLCRYPGKYAAALVVCGAHDPAQAFRYAKTPVWLLHGDQDNVVPMHYGKDIYEQVLKKNRKSRYTCYRGVNHGCWIPAFKEPELLPWLFSQRLRKVRPSTYL